jgi:hypothetical protein
VQFRFIFLNKSPFGMGSFTHPREKGGTFSVYP